MNWQNVSSLPTIWSSLDPLSQTVVLSICRYTGQDYPMAFLEPKCWWLNRQYTHTWTMQCQKESISSTQSQQLGNQLRPTRKPHTTCRAEQMFISGHVSLVHSCLATSKGTVFNKAALTFPVGCIFFKAVDTEKHTRARSLTCVSIQTFPRVSWCNRDRNVQGEKSFSC